MLKRAAAAAVSALVLLTACQNPNEASTAVPKETTVSPAMSVSPPSSPSPTPSQVPNPTITATVSVSPSPAGNTEGQSIPKTYRMNKNYFIVPVDPSGNKKVVLLTFDDGPKDKDMINGLIDTLDKHKAKAIFFTNGYRIKQHPELLKLIHDRGQLIGNHSWDHIDLKKETNASIDKQIGDVQTVVKETIGEAPHFFRPPFGSSNDYVKEKAKAEKLLFMTWSNGSLDWDEKETKQTPALVVQKVLDQLLPGSNILMHELPWTVKALDDLLTKLEEKGYGFVDPRAIETE